MLARVSSLFSRRGFNIDSLAVGPTEQPSISRMTITVTVEEPVLEQIVKQLNKLVNVIKIVEHRVETSVARELVLLKVRADAASRGQVIEIANLFRAKVVDITSDTVVIEATGDQQKIEALLRVLDPLGVKEIVQSGLIALGRGSKPITAQNQRW